MHLTNNSIAIIGAGIGGLAAALRLSDAGLDVTVFDSASDVGGKMRTVASAAGPIDAGPTVFTMRHVFEKLFDDVGESLGDHLTLTPAKILARHYWSDGSMLDLMANPDETAANIRTWGGARAEKDYRAFAERARVLYEAFDAPMMQAAIPSQAELIRKVMSRPSLVPKMAPWFTLMQSLRHSFKDKRLAQLYGRYATYVGGDPFASPALLSLISHSEALGVYAVKGGMHQLAQTLRTLAQARGATFKLNTHIKQINVQNGSICGLTTDDGTRHDAARVLFNGDPKALQDGLLGKSSRAAVPNKHVQTRSLSAHVHTFAAQPTGPDLSHHTVFFGDDPKTEFGPIRSGHLPQDPTLYICAQDRASGAQPTGMERFEIIMNAPPTTDTTASQREITQCQTLVFNTLARFGLTFTPKPTPQSLTPPATFNQLFPASHGSLYGQSPHGLMASFARPTARSPLNGLYLVGGGTHPGAGIPMATLSAQHAAEAILTDLASTSTSRPTAMRGGTSTGSATAAPAPSASSAS